MAGRFLCRRAKSISFRAACGMAVKSWLEPGPSTHSAGGGRSGRENDENRTSSLPRIIAHERGQSRNKFSFLQHSQDPIACGRRCEVLQGMAAHDVAESKHCPIGFFENLREDVETDNDREVGTARVLGWE